MSIIEIAKLKNEAEFELQKIRSSNFSIVGENKVLAYYSFLALMASDLILKKKQASLILGQDIPKQVYSKAKKVALYVRDEKTYEHDGKKILLSNEDFSSSAKSPAKRDVLQTYGHIAAYEKALIDKTLHEFNLNYSKTL